MVAIKQKTDRDNLVNIYFDDDQLRTIRDMASHMHGSFNRILSRSLTRSAEGFKKEFVSHMHRTLGYKSKMEAHRGVKVSPATIKRLRTEVWLKASRPSVVKFESADVFPHGVTYRIKGQNNEISHAFTAKMPTGHRGFFVRSNRLSPGSVNQGKMMKAAWAKQKYGTTYKHAIYELHGPSVLEYRRTEAALSIKLFDRAKRKLSDEINRYYKDEVDKYAKRTRR